MFSSTLIAAHEQWDSPRVCESIPWNPMWSFANRNLCSADFTYFTHTQTHTIRSLRGCVCVLIWNMTPVKLPYFFDPPLAALACTLVLWACRCWLEMECTGAQADIHTHDILTYQKVYVKQDVRGWSWSQFLHWTQLQMSSTCFHMLPPVPPLGDLDLSIFHDLSKRSGRR